MTVQEQLNAGASIFARIDELIREKKFPEVYKCIRETEPPAEWVEEFQSLLDEGKTYKTMKIEVLEAVATRIFPDWKISGIFSPVINQSKEKISVTVIGVIEYELPGENYLKQLHGIATEVAHNITLLPLATPKALAMAKKQAFKQLGNLFGLSLSRNMEGESVNYAKAPENALVTEAVIEINKCKTLDELVRVHNLCAKEIQNDPKFTDAILQQKKLLTLSDKKDGTK